MLFLYNFTGPAMSSRKSPPPPKTRSAPPTGRSSTPPPSPAPALCPGQRLVTAVQARIDAFAQKYASLYPAAVRCLLADCEQLTSYLRFPAEHHKRIRHSNFIERTFGETPAGSRSSASSRRG